MGAKASLRAAQAAGHSATKGISSSSACLERSFPKEQRREPVTPEQVDQWMTESIGEVEIASAPFCNLSSLFAWLLLTSIALLCR